MSRISTDDDGWNYSCSFWGSNTSYGSDNLSSIERPFACDGLDSHRSMEKPSGLFRSRLIEKGPLSGACS